MGAIEKFITGSRKLGVRARRLRSANRRIILGNGCWQQSVLEEQHTLSGIADWTDRLSADDNSEAHMTPFFKKFLGITLIVVAIFGMIFSSVGVYSVWAIRSAVIRSLDDMVELFEITLDTTEAGLNVLDQSLGATTDTLDSTLATTTGIAQTLNDISGLIGGIADIASMFGAEVDTPASDDEALSTNVQEMADDLSDITTSLNEAQEVIDRYQVNVDQAQAQLENFRENGPMWITAFAVIMTIILVWLAIAQIGLLLQGWAMVRPEPAPQTESNPASAQE